MIVSPDGIIWEVFEGDWAKDDAFVGYAAQLSE
jgi:hypothetical protein